MAGVQDGRGRQLEGTRFLRGILPMAGLLGISIVFCSPETGRNPPAAQNSFQEDPYPEREVWAAEPSGSANISVFVFRDADRTQMYDLADLPLAGIAVRVWRPNGTMVMRRSNTSGFANFTNALGDPLMDISSPGEYVFEVVPPDAWRITTDNAQQIVRFSPADSSRPGIVASEVPSAVGLAPNTTISGRAMVRTADGGLQPAIQARVTLRTAGVAAVTRPVDRRGRYSVNVTPGLWDIEIVGDNGSRAARRNVAVTDGPVVVSAMVLDEEWERHPAAVRRVVSFDDITSSDLTKVPNGLAGLLWRDLIVTRKSFYGGEGYINAAVSGDYVGYNTSGYPVLVARRGGFDFVGGVFGSAWLSAEGEQIKLRGWRGDELVFADEFRLSALGPLRFDAEYRDITRLEMATAHYWQFVVDDLVFRVSSEAERGLGAGG